MYFLLTNARVHSALIKEPSNEFWLYWKVEKANNNHVLHGILDIYYFLSFWLQFMRNLLVIPSALLPPSMCKKRGNCFQRNLKPLRPKVRTLGLAVWIWQAMVGEITSLSLFFLLSYSDPKQAFGRSPEPATWSIGWDESQSRRMWLVIGIGNASFVEHNHNEATCILIPQ